jgi:ubiquinone/menaquinone biosynthesis C-methylase UbiE
MSTVPESESEASFVEGGAIDRDRLIAYYEARAASDGDGWPAHTDAEKVALRELVQQLVGWAEAAVLKTQRFALDCACGTGWLSGALVKAGVPVIGVDLVHAMARRARGKYGQAPAAMFAVASVEALPFRDRSFGAILDVRAFHHYPDPPAAAKEWARVLVPGGALVFADILEKDQDEVGFLTEIEHAARPAIVNVRYKPHEIGYFLEQAGFEVEGVSFYRVKRTFDQIEREDCGPAGAEPAAYKAVVAGATPELREAYEIDLEGMSCRVLALLARKR